jgi:hypothetical protein
MATGKLICPNSACQQKHLVIDTDNLICSTCGTHIDDVQSQINKYERLQADARSADERQKKRLKFIAKLHLELFGVAALAGFIFHKISRAAILAFVAFGAIAVYARIRRNAPARGWALASIASLGSLFSRFWGMQRCPLR